MSPGDSCGCRHDTVGAITPVLAKPTAETTVEQAKRWPGALEVLQRFGLDQCCGAHLTLRESAAAAGVELDVLLEALLPKTAVTS